MASLKTKIVCFLLITSTAPLLCTQLTLAELQLCEKEKSCEELYKKYGNKLFEPNGKNETPLFWLIRTHNSTAPFTALAKKHLSKEEFINFINTPDNTNKTALHIAIDYNDKKSVLLLLPTTKTPLKDLILYATKIQNHAMVTLLTNQNLDADFKKLDPQGTVIAAARVAHDRRRKPRVKRKILNFLIYSGLPSSNKHGIQNHEITTLLATARKQQLQVCLSMQNRDHTEWADQCNTIALEINPQAKVWRTWEPRDIERLAMQYRSYLGLVQHLANGLRDGFSYKKQDIQDTLNEYPLISAIHYNKILQTIHKGLLGLLESGEFNDMVVVAEQ